MTSILPVAGLIAVGQSILTTYYHPVKLGPSLTVSTQLAPAGEELSSAEKGRRMQVIRGIVSIKNTGDVKLVFLGGIYTVIGYHIGSRSTAERTNFPQTLASELLDRPVQFPPFGVGRYEAPRTRPSFLKTAEVSPLLVHPVSSGTLR